MQDPISTTAHTTVLNNPYPRASWKRVGGIVTIYPITNVPGKKDSRVLHVVDEG
jgi:hypothetical protein